MSDTASPQTRRAAALARLARLEQFLAQDPGNEPLRVDTFQTALQCGEWDRARAPLQAARAGRPDDAAWTLREADWWLAQQAHARAREVLESLSARAAKDPALAAVVRYDLACADFGEGRWAECVERLRPLVEGAPADAMAQVLWLRALHRAGDLATACAWATQAQQAGRLAPAAAAVASLAAIDLGDFEAARRWSTQAGEQGAPAQMELLVARSTLALAGRDARAARLLAAQALALNPQDGRAWSASAFAALLASDLATALREFTQSLAFMPSHIGTWHGLGWTQVLRGDAAAAQSAFASALALDRNFAESHGGLAVAFAMRGQAQQAREHIELARRLDRNNLSSRYAEALLSGEAQDAKALQRLALRLLGARAAPLGGTMADWLPPAKE